MLEKLFEQCEKSCLVYCKKDEVLVEMKASSEFQKYGGFRVRESETNQLPVESVEQTMERLSREMDAYRYIDLDELVDFFTVRGRPLFLSEELKSIKVEKRREKEKTEEEDLYGAINKISA